MMAAFWRTVRLLFLVAASQAAAAQVLAASPEGPAGEAAMVAAGRLKSLQCVACHGIEGRTDNPEVPNLAGQNAGYLTQQIYAFKSGRRYSGRMTPIAQSLAAEDIQSLVLYFSQIHSAMETRHHDYDSGD